MLLDWPHDNSNGIFTFNCLTFVFGCIIMGNSHWLPQEGCTTEFSQGKFCPNVGLYRRLGFRKLSIAAKEISPKFDHPVDNILSWVNVDIEGKVDKAKKGLFDISNYWHSSSNSIWRKNIYTVLQKCLIYEYYKLY